MDNMKYPVAAGMHKLPPLPYSYNTLEPVISNTTLKIHHDKLHQKYVDNLNKAELELAAARKKGDYKYISYWENQLAFNGSGHILHSVYWTIMTGPNTGGSPGKFTASYINWYFGSISNFKEQFTQAANEVQGSGWCILGYSPSFFRLELLQCEKHQNLTQWGIIPILVCDIWEHAYFLTYLNDREKFIGEWWNLINWNVVEQRLINAANGVLPIEYQNKK